MQSAPHVEIMEIEIADPLLSFVNKVSDEIVNKLRSRLLVRIVWPATNSLRELSQFFSRSFCVQRSFNL